MKNGKEQATRHTTDELEKEMKGRGELEYFLHQHEESFVSYDVGKLLESLIKEKKISKAELARRAKMSDVYLYQIISGRRQPSRDRLLCLCVGLGLTLEETKDFLKKARETDLYAKDRRDAIIMFAIVQGWDLGRINDSLYEAGEKTLG